MKKLVLFVLIALGVSCSAIHKPQAHAAPSVTAPAPAAPAAPSSAVNMEELMSLLGGEPDAPETDVKCPATGHCVLYQRLNGPVDDEHVVHVMATLKAAKAGQIVMLDINTPGGSLSTGFELEKALESTPAQVFCVVDGDAYSMGFYLLQSCQYRVMTKRSSLMAHEPLEVTQGPTPLTIRTLEDIQADLHTSARALAEQAISRMKMTYEEFFAKVHAKNWFMAWPEAQARGAVDCVYAGTGASARKELGETGALTCQK